MKKYLQSLFLIIFIMLAVPILPLLEKNDQLRKNLLDNASSALSPTPQTTSETPAQPPAAETPNAQSPADSENDQTISVFQHQTEEILTLPFRDYLIGVVMAEMPANFHQEAIKAQAVIAHTYALRILQQETPSEQLNGAQISTNPAKHQAYLSPEQAKERFGDHYQEYFDKISNCVDAVLTEILTYEEQPILAAFHAISDGATEDCANVWGQQIPYLVSATSEGDPLSPNFLNTQQFSAEEVKQLLTAQFPEIAFPDDPKQWFQIQTNTPSGYVDQIQVADITTDGQQIRSIFSLRSASFSVEYTDEQFVFTTKGYGHGVGLSQYGADYFARQGMTYDQILAHYYPGTTLSQTPA